MATFRCQQSHSRNGYNWKFETDQDGRLYLVAKKKGMWQRIGQTFSHLKGQGGVLKAGQILTYLQKLDPSFRETDLSQLRKQLTKHGVIETRGRGTDAVWAITPGGRAKMAKANVEWV